MKKSLAEAFPPGEYLAEELEARGWSQVDFADILDRPAQFVSEIIAGKKEITRESAAQIGAALGTSAELWLNLQNTYLLSRQQQSSATLRQLDEVRRRARLNDLAPVALLRRRGYLSSASLEELEAEVLALFEMTTLDAEPSFSAAARRANNDVPLTPLQNAWLALARQRARTATVKAYDRTAAEQIASELSRTLVDADSFKHLPALLAKAGIRLVYVQALPGSKMGGATFLLDDDEAAPVIAVSGRGRRLDIVLFTILHELAHLVLGDVSKGRMLVDDDHHTLGDESAANDLAGSWALPGAPINIPDPIRQPWVLRESSRLGVHWIVLVGQLQASGELDWRTQLVKGAPTVTDQLEVWA